MNIFKNLSWKTWTIIVVVLALAAGAGYFSWQYSEAKKDVDRLSNPQEAAKVANAELIASVSRHTEVPQGETPTIATVTDASKLKSQAFFAKAVNGDKVLIYTQARRAILYRPSTDKIIEIAPINLGTSESQTTTPPPTPTPPARR
jgi:hypothetical protein